MITLTKNQIKQIKPLNNFVLVKTDRKIDEIKLANNKIYFDPSYHPEQNAPTTGEIVAICKNVTPTDGTVFDMFAGSGTTGIAALGEGMRAILIEKEQEYYDGILRRHAEHPTKT